MLKIVLLALFLGGCVKNASNEQIAMCVQTCKSINATMYYGNYSDDDGTQHCGCIRKYKINREGNNVIEQNQ
jgi:outer membrane lipoprotein-sorting protein